MRVTGEERVITRAIVSGPSLPPKNANGGHGDDFRGNGGTAQKREVKMLVEYTTY